MARYECARCGAMLNTLDPEHLCKDVAARLKEATRRALVPCEGTGSLDGYLTRMEHTAPVRRNRPPFVEPLVNGHGQFVDPRDTRSHDPHAREMLAARRERLAAVNIC